MIFQKRKSAFTLMELLIAVTLMILAITITLFATIGTNSLIERTEQRAAIVQGTRETIDSLRRGLSEITVNYASIIKGVQYFPSDSDQTFTINKVASGNSETGFAVEIRRFAASQSNNVCQIIGRARIANDNGNEQFFLDAAGDQIVLLVYKMNTAGMCEYSTSFYRGVLTSSTLDVTNFLMSIIKADYTCGAITCSVGQLRYRIALQSSTFSNNRQSAIDVSGSVPILVEHKNLPATLQGISIDPVGPVTLAPGGTQVFLIKAGYSDNSVVDVTDDSVVTPQGGTYSQLNNTYTAGSSQGLYEIRATYQGFVATASVNITAGQSQVTLTQLTLTPSTACVQSSQTLNFTVIGTYSDNSTQNLTLSATYQIAAPAFGSVNFGVYQAAASQYTDTVTASVGAVTSNQSIIEVKSSCGVIIEPPPPPPPPPEEEPAPGPGPGTGGAL